MAEVTIEAPVWAAGGVVWRADDQGEVEVLLIHRPKYNDWSFPKGKVDPGESLEQCAVREVEEETRLRCTLGHGLVSTSYLDRKGRPKVVHYWEMTVAGGDFEPTDEVDEIRWLPLAQADRLLSYGRDRGVLAAFAAFARSGTSR